MVESPSLFAIDTLRRHAERRRQGIPTVSVLVNTGESVPAFWRDSIGKSAAGVAHVHDPHFSAMVGDWLAYVDQHCDISAALDRFLKSSLPPTDRNLIEQLRHKTPHEAAMALGQFLPDEPHPHPSWLVRELVRQRATSPGTLPSLGRLCEAQTRTSVHLLTAAHDLLSPDHAPGLLLTRGSATDGDAWLAAAADSLAQLAIAVPALPLAISVDSPTIDRFMTSCHLTRTGAMIREGLIFVNHSPQLDFTAAQRATTTTTGTAVAAPAPISLNPAPSAVESDSADSAPTPSVRTREEDDLARSAAERFLFDRLQEFSETTGLFALNEVIAAEGVHAQKAEIDLCSPSLRIAIEIDGYYHFGEPEAYRRDRRKDWALQQAGYVILRFLADDVVDQLETVLERIAATVRRQRAQKRTQGESCR